MEMALIYSLMVTLILEVTKLENLMDLDDISGKEGVPMWGNLFME